MPGLFAGSSATSRPRHVRLCLAAALLCCWGQAVRCCRPGRASSPPLAFVALLLEPSGPLQLRHRHGRPRSVATLAEGPGGGDGSADDDATRQMKANAVAAISRDAAKQMRAATTPQGKAQVRAQEIQRKVIALRGGGAGAAAVARQYKDQQKQLQQQQTSANDGGASAGVPADLPSAG
mmetsp:Transcript_12818/g.34720  ORF Transcript_12818/g.34720 Transcript_12818/m.34720 type:complete len:179 (+) Transcript_12818:53-589(+)